MSNDADARIVVSIGDELLDTIHVSGEPVEQPKYDMKEVLKYAIHGIDRELEWCVDFGVKHTMNKISELIQLRKTLSQELEELSGNAETES